MILRKILYQLFFFVEYYFICRADPVSFLRVQGAKIGENCDIIAGVKSFGAEPYLIRLGNNVTLAGGVSLITHDGATRIFRKFEPRWKPGMGNYGVIEIGDNVFVGENSTVLPGVHINSNSIIAAGSVVTKEVLSGTIVAGVPARIIGMVKDYQERSVKNAICLPKWDTKSKRRILTQHFWKEKSDDRTGD